MGCRLKIHVNERRVNEGLFWLGNWELEKPTDTAEVCPYCQSDADTTIDDWDGNNLEQWYCNKCRAYYVIASKMVQLNDIECPKCGESDLDNLERYDWDGNTYEKWSCKSCGNTFIVTYDAIPRHVYYGKYE